MGAARIAYLRLGFVHAIAVPRFHDRHRREGPRAHGHIRQLVGGAVRVNCVEVGARYVHPPQHERRANVALVPEKVPLQHGHCRDHARLRACVESPARNKMEVEN